MKKWVKTVLVSCAVAVLAGAGFWIWHVESEKREAKTLLGQSRLQTIKR